MGGKRKRKWHRLRKVYQHLKTGRMSMCYSAWLGIRDNSKDYKRTCCRGGYVETYPLYSALYGHVSVLTRLRVR